MQNSVSLRARLVQLNDKARQAVAGLVIATITSPAFAGSPSSGGSGMPWEGPLNTILTSIQGPVARVMILLSIIITGIMMAFGEHGSGMKKVMGIAFGGSIVIGAVSFVSSLFGASF
jgi:type IV secretory pathway VirB2 component (pilin)